jgi:predicted NAD/FAD-dependent oxidoreductase
MLVIQARPVFSAAHMNDPAESWSRRLLEEAGAIHGTWTAAPELVQAHPWRKARVAPGSELARPLAIRLEAGALLGIAGDGFHDAGGVEGAYRSGIFLAERFAESLEQSA